MANDTFAYKPLGKRLAEIQHKTRFWRQIISTMLLFPVDLTAKITFILDIDLIYF